MRKETDVLVAGAGPVGMFAALRLARSGIKVIVADESWGPASRSYALALHPHSLRLFQELGMVEELMRKGRQLYAISFFEEGKRKARLSFADLPGDAPCVLVLPQSELEETLAARLRKEKVELLWNHRVDGIEQQSRGVRTGISRLHMDSTGYASRQGGREVDRSLEVDSSFLIGADGHHSQVRRLLGIEFPEVADALLYAVFEFEADRPAVHEVETVLHRGGVSVCWPLRGNRYRWSFRLGPYEQLPEPRLKSRLSVQVGGYPFPYLDEHHLQELIGRHAPWFEVEPRKVEWSIAVRFERRLARSFGQGNVWLAGDAAHLAEPSGVHSMNVGFSEADELAGILTGAVRSGDPFAALVEREGVVASGPDLESYGESRRSQWKRLLGMEPAVRATPAAGDFARSRLNDLISCLPASEDDLKPILSQIGLEPINAGQ